MITPPRPTIILPNIILPNMPATLFTAVAIFLLGDCATHAADRPNIVVLVAEDMGFSDVGCFGRQMETPNIDRLAENGLRYSHFFNAGRCCPSRASILTGLYPHQADVGHMLTDNVGRVIEHLKQIGELENTLIVFVSDNGDTKETGLFGIKGRREHRREP